MVHAREHVTLLPYHVTLICYKSSLALPTSSLACVHRAGTDRCGPVLASPSLMEEVGLSPFKNQRHTRQSPAAAVSPLDPNVDYYGCGSEVTHLR